MSDEDEESEAEQVSKSVIVAKVGKGNRNNALLEEIKQREIRNESKSRVLTVFKVDRDCELKGVSVLEDYSCHLQQDEISYNEDSHIRFYVMQLLERADGKKWQVWTKQGRLSSDKFTTSVKDFYNKYDAMVEFEVVFQKKTANKWSDRQYF